MNRLTLCIPFAILLVAQISNAQEQSNTDFVYTIKHYNIESGLSHNATYNIEKDQNENMLVLTRTGLDMISFGKVINIQKLNPVFNNNIHAKIISDAPGNTKIINPYHFFEINDNGFRHIDLNKLQSNTYPFPLAQIRGWFLTEDQKLFAFNQDFALLQFHSIDSAEVIIDKIDFESHPRSDFNYVKLVDDRWLYINQTIGYKHKKLHVIDLIEKSVQLIEESADLKTKLFPIKTWKRNSKHLSPHTSLSVFLDQELDFISTVEAYSAVFYDAHSQLFWYIEDHILHGFDPLKGFVHQVDLPKVFYNANMIFDQGTIWLSSSFDGIYQVNIEEKKFKSFVTLNKGGPRNIIQDREQHIWLANMGIMDANEGFKFIDEDINLKNNLVFMDRSGFIWVVKGLSSTFLKYNSQKQLIEEFKLPIESNSNRYWTMAEDADGTVWIAGIEKMIGIQPDNNLQEVQFEYPLPYFIYHIEVEDSEHFWLCTSRGLFLVDRTSGKLKEFGNYQQTDASLPATAFHHMYKDRDSIYWIATGSNGLLRWDRKIDLQKNPTAAVKVYDTSFGMPSNIMHAVYEDDNGFLWIPSEYGVIQFHKQSEHFNYYLEEDGIVNNEFNRSSHYKDEEGNIYFGGVKGFIKFHPKDFTIDQTKSEVTIFSLQQFKDKRYNDYFDQYASTGKIDFETPYDFFTLKFGNNNSVSEDTYRYFYTYNEQDWIPNNSYTININNLFPGKHQLHIRKENLIGDVLGNLTIPIQVPKPFYLKYWFFSLVLLALTGIIYLLFKLQLEYYRIQKANLEKLVKERTKEIEQDKIIIEHQAKTLEHLHNKKSFLFKNIAHELRNPLTLIFGAAKMLEKQVAQITEKRVDKKYINTITSSGDRILSLSEEVLFLAKLEANTESIHQAPISLFLLFDKIINHYKVIAEFQNKELHFDFEMSKDMVVQLDAVKAEKIITNLLSNAFKYTPKGAKVTLTVYKEQDQFITKVRDTGYGISKKEIPLIFEPYYRSARVTHKFDALEGTGGTGIGLTIVKKLTSILKGEITVESELNQGSLFTVKLPLVPVSKAQQANLVHAQASPEEESNHSENLPVKKNHHILIVDDHPGVIDFIKDLLEPNYIISVASNGKSALEIIEEKSKSKSELMISLIICDIMMPEMDGIQFASHLKKHVTWKWIPIIFLTGYNDESTKKHALRIGIEDYLIKPFDPDELKSRVINLLNNQKNILFEEELEGEATQTSFDSKWIKQFNEVVQKNLENINLDVDFLAGEMAISKRQLTRKIKQQTGLTPSKYVQEVRLQKARVLLEDKTYYSVSAVAYSAGFKSPKYFSKQFKERFGRLPSSYYK